MRPTEHSSYYPLLNAITNLNYNYSEDLEKAIIKWKWITKGRMKFPHLAPRSQSSEDILEFDSAIKRFVKIIERHNMKFSWPVDREVYEVELKRMKLEVFGQVGS